MSCPSGKKQTQKTCEKCGKLFTQKRKWARFCSAECRTAAWCEKNPRVSVVDTHNK